MTSAPPTTALPALPQESTYRQLRPTPRIFVFMALLLGGAISIGAREVARWQYIAENFDSEWVLGEVAAVSAISLAVVGFLLGRVIDRRDPRPYVVLTYVIAGTGNLGVGLVLVNGPIPQSIVLIGAVFDGAAIGMLGVSLLKTQAAFVRPGAEGAAEILNILRLGVGGVVGAILAGMSPSPAVTLLASAALLVPCTIGIWITMRPVQPRLPSVSGRSTSIPLMTYLRETPFITKSVGLDLTLSLVIPTQLVNLVLFNMDVPELASLSIAAGMVGVLVGRLALMWLGFRGSPRTIVLVTVSGLGAIQFLGAITLTGGWLLEQLILLPLIVIVGTACGTYAQGLIAALIQQKVAEDNRGGVAAILVVGRNVLIAIGALLGTLVVATVGGPVFLALLATSLVIVIVITRGFRALPG